VVFGLSPVSLASRYGPGSDFQGDVTGKNKGFIPFTDIDRLFGCEPNLIESAVPTQSKVTDAESIIEK
jgi:hypothetical protein